MSKPFYAGSTLYELEDNVIILKREEMTCYHKREYDYVEFKRIIFTSSSDAEYLFDKMKDMFEYGKQTGARLSKYKFNESLRALINGED